MYIFSSVLQAKPGRAAGIGAAAVQLADMIEQSGGADAVAWQGVLGAPYGAFLVSARFETLPAYVDASSVMQQNPAFAELSASIADDLNQPADIALSEIIAARPTYAPKPFVSVTRAVIAAGQFSAAMQWSTEFLEFAEQVTGSGGILTANVGGRVGDIGFVFAAADAAEWQENNAKLFADPGYVARLDQTDGLFEPGGDLQVLMQDISSAGGER